MKLKDTFLNNFFSDRNVGAFSRSSRFLVDAVSKNFASPINVAIEFGAGNGVMTRAILKKLAPDGKLIVVEQNEAFLESLRHMSDSRIIVVSGLAQDFEYEKYLGTSEKADLIIASIPFSFLKETEREYVCAQAAGYLSEKGTFIIFHQYSLLMKGVAKKYFASVKSTFMPWNIFPCFFIIARR